MQQRHATTARHARAADDPERNPASERHRPRVLAQGGLWFHHPRSVRISGCLPRGRPLHSRRLMDLQRFALGFAALVAALAMGCQPKIGDSCKQHTDCSTAGTRICEPNFPGGYCTIFNCEPDNCPDEAVCVAYQSVTSTKPACADTLDQRLERTFCLRGCSTRTAIVAAGTPAWTSVTQPNAWGAVIVEHGIPRNQDLHDRSSRAAAAAERSIRRRFARRRSTRRSRPFRTAPRPFPTPVRSDRSPRRLRSDAGRRLRRCGKVGP